MNVTALILAGGQSSRMGTDKALIRWDGIPILQRVVNAVTECHLPMVILSPWPERYRPTIHGEIQWVLETQPGQGPLRGLSQVLPHLTSDWILVLACDLPCLDPATLQNWITHLPQISPWVQAWVPQYQARWDPLCAFYRQSLAHPLALFCQSGGSSFIQWLETLRVEPILLTSTEIQMLHNCNTPTDLWVESS
jgi:molybdopterin-guanine dinucleotide biosynthesis protein A